MGRRHDEEIEAVELLEDDEWDDATPVVRTTRRRRWPEAILAALALVVVVAIGAAGDDGGSDDDATDMPTTTTTRPRRTTSSTRPRPTTTTTTWPAFLAPTGPVLGPDAAATGTSVVVMEEDGTVAVLDLDTGALCRTDEVARGGWLSWQHLGPLPAAVLFDDRGQAQLVDGSCSVSTLRLQPSGWLPALTATSAWAMRDGPSPVLEERSLADGSLLREVAVPAYSAVVSDDETMVVAIAGEMVAFGLDQRDGGRTLGSGQPIAVGGGTLVAIRCTGLDCGVVLIDLDTGRSTPTELPMPTTWEIAAMSPDGRWLFYSRPNGNEGTEPLLADLTTGTTTDVRGGPCSFSADSQWLLCLRPSVAEAMRLDDGAFVDFDDAFNGPIQGFVTITNR